MSYDLYCYKSQLGRPDLDEAQAVIDVEEDEENEDVQSDPATKLKIAKALLDFNPRLESFEFDFNAIAELQKISVDEAKEQFDHIELNTPEGDLATQITIFDNNVSITIPYWYSGDKAKTVSTFLLVDPVLLQLHQLVNLVFYMDSFLLIASTAHFFCNIIKTL